MKNLTSYFWLLFASLLLTGCVVTDEQRPTNVKYIEKTDPTWQQHLQQVKQIQGYQALGQLGYISTKERFSTRFDWQYNNPQNYTLKLYSTISSETLQIQMHTKGMTISDNKGRQRSAADAKMLLREIIKSVKITYWPLSAMPSTAKLGQRIICLIKLITNRRCRKVSY